MTWKMIRAWACWLSRACAALPLAAAPQPGKIRGVVVDPHGTPQMGATVFVVSEQSAMPLPVQLLTNDRGLFSTDGLASGFYSIRATLAGFLPAVEQHVHVSDQQITQLQIELGSVFSRSKNSAGRPIRNRRRMNGPGSCALPLRLGRFCAGMKAKCFSAGSPSPRKSRSKSNGAQPFRADQRQHASGLDFQSTGRAGYRLCLR